MYGSVGGAFASRLGIRNEGIYTQFVHTACKTEKAEKGFSSGLFDASRYTGAALRYTGCL